MKEDLEELLNSGVNIVCSECGEEIKFDSFEEGGREMVERGMLCEDCDGEES